MIVLELAEQTNKRVLMHFGLILGSGFFVMFGLVLPWIWGYSYPVWPWLFAAVVGGLAVTAPKLLQPLHVIWMKLGHVLGWINTRIILGIVFFVLFVPMGFLLRSFSNKLMTRKFDKLTTSYRKLCKIHRPRSLEKPF